MRWARMGHPRMIEAVRQLIGPYFLINCSPFPVITYNSPPGHERFDPGYHVDWPSETKLPKPHDERHLKGIIHFGTVEPGGGAFMLYPQSHHLVAESLNWRGIRRLETETARGDCPPWRRGSANGIDCYIKIPLFFKKSMRF